MSLIHQVGRRCRHCKRPDATILATDQLVAKSSAPFHIGCAVKYRKELEDKVNRVADARRESFSAKKAAKASFEKETKKPRQALPAGLAIDFS